VGEWWDGVAVLPEQTGGGGFDVGCSRGEVCVGDGECFHLPGRGRWLGGEDRLLTGYQTALLWIAITGGSRLFSFSLSIYIYI
jgi:hypothetical protein